ncbi:hypothetical protein [Paraburkholderia ferrariae]|uniref:hypothetical protein n=1 Tax=Paraburkholderia ferrariae TaxID=386056 RepID=UPI0012EBD18A|nr:hypothetical protein [Paraburkholderia ferrariae]
MNFHCHFISPGEPARFWDRSGSVTSKHAWFRKEFGAAISFAVCQKPLQNVNAGRWQRTCRFAPLFGGSEQAQSRIDARDAASSRPAGSQRLDGANQGAQRINYGAHRLPAGKTAAKERRRGRPAGQATKQIEDRQLLLSKAFASFVMTAEF